MSGRAGCGEGAALTPAVRRTQAALGAGMRCVITYTASTRGQAFPGAERILEGLSGAALAELAQGGAAFDDRVAMVAS